jgi:beta-glucosidase
MARFGVVAADAVVPANVKKIAAMADAALVCVGFNSDLEGGGDNFSGGEGESYDRTFSLPFGQDVLIKAVAAANPKTVVTVTSGGGFDSRAWLPDVPALIENWYLGQEGARALTEILFGLRSPEGKLPITMENSWADNPVHDHYYPEGGMTSADPHVKYAEGVFVGYRYYTTSGCRPLFPFGFGLSYTTFAFSKLSVPATGDSDQGVTVTVEVSNTGPRAGAEVVQLYVGDPSARVPRPVKELKAFEKIRLEPGMSHRVKFHLGRRAFAYFDSTAHRWRVDPGRFVLYVGDSSEATPLTAEVRLDR